MLIKTKCSRETHQAKEEGIQGVPLLMNPTKKITAGPLLSLWLGSIPQLLGHEQAIQHWCHRLAHSPLNGIFLAPYCACGVGMPHAISSAVAFSHSTFLLNPKTYLKRMSVCRSTRSTSCNIFVFASANTSERRSEPMPRAKPKQSPAAAHRPLLCKINIGLEWAIQPIK